MSVYTKNNEGKVTKIAGMITQRLNTRWFLCARSLEDGIEYYTVPADAQLYFKNLDAFTIYSFGFNEPNTTLNPKLRYGNTVLDIRDFTNEGGGLVIGQLSGVYQMFTQDLNNDPKIYFVGTTHPDAIDAEVSTTSTNAVQNQAITKYANDLLSKASKVEIDNTTITKNSQEQIQAVGVMDETNNANKVHSALTKEQFNALTEYDENTFYPITDETGVDSIGGASGDITLGDGLSMTGNILSASASGGSKLYEHIIGIDLNNYGDNIKLVIINNTNEVFDFSKLTDFLSNRTNKSYPITTGAGTLGGRTVLYMGDVIYNITVGGNPFFVEYCYLKKETQDITINEQTYNVITDCTLEKTTYRTSQVYRVTDVVREL